MPEEIADSSGVSMNMAIKNISIFPHAVELVKKKKLRPRAIETNMEFLRIIACI